MKRILFVLGTMLALMVTASPVLAQTLYVHGGAGFPSSSAFKNAYKSGFNAGVGVGIPITSTWEAVVRGNYDQFNNDLAGIDNFSSYSASANLKANAPMVRSRIMPYALGGAGIFRLGIQDAYETEFGLQIGAGVAVRTSPRMNLTLEPNYVFVLNEGENTKYFPMRVGASFKL